MEKAFPDKTFIGAPGADGNCNCNICPYMALNTMEKLYVALRDLEPRIEIEEDLRLKAKKSLDAMLAMASASVGMGDLGPRSDEHTSELQSLMRHPYTLISLKKQKKKRKSDTHEETNT